jgi:hypothetical protein
MSPIVKAGQQTRSSLTRSLYGRLGSARLGSLSYNEPSRAKILAC